MCLWFCAITCAANWYCETSEISNIKSMPKIETRYAEWLTSDEYLSNQSLLQYCLFHVNPSAPSDCCLWNVALPRTRTLIRILFWSQTGRYLANKWGHFSNCRGNIHRLCFQSLSRYVSHSEIDKCASMSWQGCLYSTCYATLKLLDVQPLQSKAHGQVSAMWSQML